jgi:lipid A disaccharide synthetase
MKFKRIVLKEHGIMELILHYNRVLIVYKKQVVTLKKKKPFFIMLIDKFQNK